MTVDSQMREQVLFESYRSPGFVDTQKALQEAMDILEQKIYKLKPSPTRRELQKLYDEIRTSVADAYKPLPKQIQKEAAQASRLVFSANAGRRLPILPIKNTIKQDLNIQGYDFTELMKTTSESHARKLKVEIASHIASGSTLPEIVRAMRSKNAKLTNMQLRSSINTTIAQARAEGRYAAFKDLEDSIEGYTYLATLDSRTSSICRDLDGRKWKTDITHVPYKPPVHFNCRSVLIPTVESYGLVSRASAKGPVDSTMTYNQWLGSQTPAFQKAVLGTSAYEAYTAGTLTAPTLYDTIDRDRRTMEDIESVLNPVIYKGYRTAETQIWTEASFNALLEGGIQIGTPSVRKKGAGFVIQSAKGAFSYALDVSKKEATLVLLDIPASLRRKGLGTESIKSLRAVASAGKKQLKIKAGDSGDYKDGVFIWLSSGLTEPENPKAFARSLLQRLGYEGVDYIYVEGLLDKKDYRKLFTDKTYEKDIKNALGSLNLTLNVI